MGRNCEFYCQQGCFAGFANIIQEIVFNSINSEIWAELNSATDAGISDELEQHFECEFLSFVVLLFNKQDSFFNVLS